MCTGEAGHAAPGRSGSSGFSDYAAAYLIHQGAELRDVVEQLGHSQISLTANTYGHLFIERKRQLAKGMGEFLRKATPAS